MSEQDVQDVEAAWLGREPWQPDWAIHPGEMLSEVMEENGVSIRVASRSLRWPEDHLAEIIDGKRDISPRMADQLQALFSIPSGMWVRMQERYWAWKLENSCAPARQQEREAGAGGREG